MSFEMSIIHWHCSVWMSNVDDETTRNKHCELPTSYFGTASYWNDNVMRISKVRLRLLQERLRLMRWRMTTDTDKECSLSWWGRLTLGEGDSKPQPDWSSHWSGGGQRRTLQMLVSVLCKTCSFCSSLQSVRTYRRSLWSRAGIAPSSSHDPSSFSSVRPCPSDLHSPWLLKEYLPYKCNY